MKLISFEDLDDNLIIDDHQIIIQNKLQPLASKNCMNLISELSKDKDNTSIDYSFLKSLNTEFIP